MRTQPSAWLGLHRAQMQVVQTITRKRFLTEVGPLRLQKALLLKAGLRECLQTGMAAALARLGAGRGRARCNGGRDLMRQPK